MKRRPALGTAATHNVRAKRFHVISPAGVLLAGNDELERAKESARRFGNGARVVTKQGVEVTR